MKKIQETIMRDIGWKLLSVIIAVTLWFMVINIEHPVDTRTYTQTIKFENQEQLANQGLTVRGLSELENMKISIKVKAQRTVLDRLSQYKGSIKASVDLQKAVGYEHGETMSVPIDVKLPEIVGTNLEILNKTPQAMEITIEKLSSKRLEAEVALSGSVPSGYLLQNAIASPGIVTVSGASSLVAKVAKVRADVNLDGMGSSSDVNVIPLACDSAGTIVRGVSILPSEVTVHVNLSQSKKVALVANAIGVPASGYTMGEITVSPSTIEVQGANEALVNLIEIQLPSIDVYDAARSVSRSFVATDIIPAGLTLKQGAPSNISVRVEIKQEGKGRLAIPTSSIVGGAELKTGLSYTIDTDSLLIEVEGMGKTDSSALGNVTASADFSGITAVGRYTLMVNVNLPPGLTLASTQPVINISVTEDAVIAPETPEETVKDPPKEIPKDPSKNLDKEIVTPTETPIENNTELPNTLPPENIDDTDGEDI